MPSLIMDLILSFSLFLLTLQRLGRSGHGAKMAEGSPTFEELQWKEPYESDGKTPIQVYECITNGESRLTDIKTASVPGKQLPKAKSHRSMLYSPAGHVPLPLKVY